MGGVLKNARVIILWEGVVWQALFWILSNPGYMPCKIESLPLWHKIENLCLQ